MIEYKMDRSFCVMINPAKVLCAVQDSQFFNTVNGLEKKTQYPISAKLLGF